MSENKYVPALRFSDFEGEWQITPLSTLGDRIRGAVKAGPFGSALKKEFYVERGYKVYGQEQVISSNPYLGDYYIDDKKYNSLKSCAVRPGDILISLVGTIGRVLVIPEDAEAGIINPRLLRISLDVQKSEPIFIKYFLTRKKTVSTLESWSQGGTMGVLNASLFKKLPIALPQLKEQQKIASFLSKVDEKIALLTEKKDKLTEYKKGVMQQLFNGKWAYVDGKEDGKLTFVPPTLRFKADDGSEFPDWEEKKLGAVTSSIKSGKSKATENGNFPLWGSTGKIGLTDDASHNGHFILVARVGANAGKLNEVSGKFGVSDNTLVLDIKEHHNLEFIKYALLNFNLNRLIFGSGQPLITGGDLKMHKMIIPTLSEQDKVASFLTSLDKKINLANSELEKAQQWKKGLLQQMFV